LWYKLAFLPATGELPYGKDAVGQGNPGRFNLMSDHKPSEPSGLTRRRALGRLVELARAASAGWLALPSIRVSAIAPSPVAIAPGAVSPHPTSFFSIDQKATISALADLIIPADEVSPGAKAAGVERYVDFIVANASPEDQKAWVDGLRALDETSRTKFGSEFRALPAGQQDQLLAEIAGEEASPRTGAGRFFVRVKHAVAEGFYTSKIGLQDDLKYQGNTYVEAPATCADQFGTGQASKDAKKTDDHHPATHCDHASGGK